MALKKALYYSIRFNLHDDIVAVTSEKSNGRWFGRYTKDNSGTHGAPGYGGSDIIGRFESIDDAEKKRFQMAAVRSHFQSRRDAIMEEVNALYREERKQIAELIDDQSK